MRLALSNIGVGSEVIVRSIPKVLLLGTVVLAFGAAACGGDDDDEASETVTVTVTSAGEPDTTAADRGTIVNVEEYWMRKVLPNNRLTNGFFGYRVFPPSGPAIFLSIDRLSYWEHS